MKRKAGCILLAVLMACACASFAGCGVGDDPDTVEIWWGAGSNYKPSFVEAIDRYSKANPSFKYKISYQTSNDYFAKYQAQLLAGNSNIPDIVILGHTNIQSLAVSNRLVNMDDYGINTIKDKFLPATWNANLYKNKTYGVPLDCNTTALMYNKDIFNASKAKINEARIAVGLVAVENVYPTADWVWEDFYSACKGIKASGKVAFEFPSLADSSGFTTMTYTSWLARAGETLMSEDLTTSNLASEKSKETLNKIVDLNEKGYFNAGAWEEGSFYAGKIAMMEMGSWNISQITKEGQNFGVAPLVAFSKDVGSKAPLGQYSLAVSEASAQKQAAVDFIKFLTTDDKFTKDYTQAQNIFSPLIETLKDPFYSAGHMAIYKEALNTCVSRQGSPAWYKIENYVQKAIESILVDGSKKKTVEEAVAYYNPLMQTELNKFKD